MPARSSIETLPAAVQAAVQKAIAEGSTIDEIVAIIEDLGHERSRSAVGRYSKSYRNIVATQRDTQALAEALGSRFGDQDDPTVRLLLQLASTVVTQASLAVIDSDKAATPFDAQMIAKASAQIATGAKADADRRRAERKAAFAQSAEEAAKVAKAKGASPEIIAAITRHLLGLE